LAFIDIEAIIFDIISTYYYFRYYISLDFQLFRYAIFRVFAAIFADSITLILFIVADELAAIKLMPARAFADGFSPAPPFSRQDEPTCLRQPFDAMPPLPTAAISPHYATLSPAEGHYSLRRRFPHCATFTLAMPFGRCSAACCDLQPPVCAGTCRVVLTLR